MRHIQRVIIDKITNTVVGSHTGDELVVHTGGNRFCLFSIFTSFSIKIIISIAVIGCNKTQRGSSLLATLEVQTNKYPWLFLRRRLWLNCMPPQKCSDWLVHCEMRWMKSMDIIKRFDSSRRAEHQRQSSTSLFAAVPSSPRLVSDRGGGLMSVSICNCVALQCFFCCCSSYSSASLWPEINPGNVKQGEDEEENLEYQHQQQTTENTALGHISLN